MKKKPGTTYIYYLTESVLHCICSVSDSTNLRAMGTVIEYECKGRGYAFDYANSVSDENGTVVSNDDLISYYYTTNINKIKVTCTKERYGS